MTIELDLSLERARESFFTGIKAFEAGQLTEARACFEDALRHAPDRPSVLLNLGTTLFKLGDYLAAVPLLEKVVEAEPHERDAWGPLGLSYEELGQWEKAARALRKAVEMLPHQPGLWLASGRCELRVNSVERGLKAFDKAVELAPNSWEAWSERGSLLRELGHHDEAAACFEKVLALGGDPELHGFYLAAVRQSELPPGPPRSYVESLFDQYASDFDSHLVSHLRYTAHETLVRPLLETGRRYELALDLGCGTGLCGKLLSPFADAIEGVDLSMQMVERARSCGAYRRVEHQDLLPFLEEVTHPANVVVAADVFIYVGELAPVFRAVRAVLARQGYFAFTVEICRNSAGFQLMPSLRYRHSREYIVRLATEHGFRIAGEFEAPLRFDQQEPVQGLFVYLSIPE